MDKAADKLDELSESTGADIGVKAKLSDELADDAGFLRKLKPSLIVARAGGEHPPEPHAAERPRARRPAGTSSGPNPFVVAAAALVLGIVVARLIDWRG